MDRQDRQDRQDDRRSDLSMFICEAAVGLKPVYETSQHAWAAKEW